MVCEILSISLGRSNGKSKISHILLCDTLTAWGYGSMLWASGLPGICLWIKARGLGQGCTRPAGRAPDRPSPRAAGPRAGSTVVFSKWDIGNTSLCVASPEQANSHSSDASYHGEQGYNKKSSGLWQYENSLFHQALQGIYCRTMKL